MKSRATLCGFLLFTHAMYADAALITIDFDTPLANYVPEFTSYRSISDEFLPLGITFGGSYVGDANPLSCTPSSPGNCSGNLRLYAGSAGSSTGTVSIYFENGTDYFSALVFTNRVTGNELKAYDAAGNLLSQMDAPSNIARATFSGIGDIYSITMSTGSSGHSYDDIVFNSIVVPIPATAWLFGSGLLGLIGIARKKEP